MYIRAQDRNKTMRGYVIPPLLPPSQRSRPRRHCDLITFNFSDNKNIRMCTTLNKIHIFTITFYTKRQSLEKIKKKILDVHHCFRPPVLYHVYVANLHARNDSYIVFVHQRLNSSILNNNRFFFCILTFFNVTVIIIITHYYNESYTTLTRHVHV